MHVSLSFLSPFTEGPQKSEGIAAPGAAQIRVAARTPRGGLMAGVTVVRCVHCFTATGFETRGGLDA